MEAIGLNPIRLDAIGIDPIRLNAIRLGVPGASSGSSGRPYIDPEVLASLVAVCICDGKSNNDPDRAVIKNLVDPANPFVISNAAYKLNSGFGKYEEDFTSWIKYPNVETDGFNIWVNSIFDSDWLLYRSVNTSGIKATKIRVTGIPQNGAILYHYIKNSDDVERTTLIIEKDGIYELPESFIIKGSTITVGFQLRTPKNIDYTKIKIEQIPSFQGAFYADGVNDMITSTKTMSGMLGGGNKCTVISFITHISGAGKYNIIGDGGIQVSDYSGQSFMAGCSSKSGEKIVELGDKEKIQAFQYTTFDSKLSIGSLETGLEISSYAYYGTFVFNKDSVPIDWIHQVIAYFYLDKYVTADIIYDTIRQGITNENHASFNDELVDLSGNGHNLKIYNSAWNKESGINDEGAWQTDGVSDYGQYVGNLGLKDYTVAVDRAYPSLKGNGVPIISSINGNTVSPFLFEFADNTGVVRPYSFGTTTVLSSMELNRKISYQSTYIYDGTTIIKGVQPNTGSGLTIGRFGIDTQYANIALWSLLLFPYTLSEFLLERQLKRYKLGTLYPDMVEFRPIVKSNVEYELISFATSTSLIDKIVTGDYMKLGTLYVYVKPKSDNDRVVDIRINGIPAKLEAIQTNGQFRFKGEVSKSPQKIDITIDEYIRYEDIVQPYPFIFPIVDTNNKVYSWGDKIKVGTEIKFAYGSNLLPQLYELRGKVMFNGNAFDEDSKHIIGKTNIFTLTEAPKYLKDNEPNCILAPQILRIPNASYKILGYIPDLTGKGNHGKINNSAYAGMSGANGYAVDFNSWQKYSGVQITDSKITLDKTHSSQWICYVISNTVVPTFKVMITGIPTGGSLRIFSGSINIVLTNGENTIQGFTANGGTGFFIYSGLELDWSNLVIQQIGQYEGSFCLDGVDDFITIPTITTGIKQALIKVNWQSQITNFHFIADFRDGSNNANYCLVQTTENEIAYASGNNTYIDGVLNTNIKSMQLRNITHNIVHQYSSANYSTVYIGRRYTNNNYMKMALFTFISFPEISTEKDIKELNDIVGIEGGYVESPDYYFDAYGKSNNLDEDIDYQGSGTANTKGIFMISLLQVYKFLKITEMVVVSYQLEIVN